MAERPDADGQLRACDADDGFVASLRTATGVTAVIDCAIESPVMTGERTAVVGSTGMLELDDRVIVLRTAAGDVETHEIDLQGKNSLILSMERWAEPPATRSGTVASSPDGRPSTTGSPAQLRWIRWGAENDCVTDAGRALPAEFVDLERFAERWSLPTEAERWAQRHTSSIEDMRELYEAMSPRVDAILTYCDGFPLDDLPEEARTALSRSRS